MHFRNSSFKHKIKRLQISQEPVYGKFYLHEMVAVNLKIKNLLLEKRKENI